MSISAVERDTGLSKDTLRIWERRYGFPLPDRDAVGERSYPFEQVERLRTIKRLLDAGHRPGRIVAMAAGDLDLLSSATGLREPTRPPEAQARAAPDLVGFMATIRQHEVELLRDMMARALARMGLGRFVLDVIAPLNAQVGEAWMPKTLLLADDADEAGDFVASLEGVASVLPLGTSVVRAYFTTDGVLGSRNKLINGINAGTGFVSYFGHGGFDQLAGESVLTTWDAPLLTNALQPAVMTAMTCLVGNSSLPGASSLGEALVRQAGGGLVAMWGPSGWSENHLAEPLANEFYRAAFDPGTERIGDAVTASRKAYRDSGRPAWMLSIYNLLGDPALRLR